jgi:hypothetical protein
MNGFPKVAKLFPSLGTNNDLHGRLHRPLPTAILYHHKDTEQSERNVMLFFQRLKQLKHFIKDP